ncbi:MAG: LysR family transcriptional regulator [Pseudomonadota bacterium]
MLNYNHLRYFWIVAKDGHLTRAAGKLNLSQSALSAQIKKLEKRLGHDLFERRGRGLALTEAGQLALDHCEEIFATGEALIRSLSHQAPGRRTFRIGALSTLSRNFQITWLRGIYRDHDLSCTIRSGTMAELISLLKAHRLDVVLANQTPLRDATTAWTARVIDTQPVSLIGTPTRVAGRTDLTTLLASEPVILPTADSGYRNGIDLMVDRLGLSLNIVAEVDDMAMLRLLAREDLGIALLPPIVVTDELASGQLIEVSPLPDVVEVFSAITLKRTFAHSALEGLLD